MGSFFEQLQSLDESMKQKILIVATIVIMVVVVYVWIGYFNGIVAGVSQPDQSVAQVQPQATQPTSGGNSVWQDMQNGMANMINAFKQPGQYTIEPK